MPDSLDNPNRINASPTKDFFIHMLTRDIPLSRAILDLVDNAVDGARRLRPEANYAGLWVRIEINQGHFKIADNCGGIPVDVARNYAFRFGRAKSAPLTPGSVGQFGVGMKRAFFKLGSKFTVSSKTATSRFALDVNVEDWMARGDEDETTNPSTVDPWHFDFTTVEENMAAVPPEEIGTTIEITGLHEAVASSFGLDAFITKLKQEVRLACTVSIDKGLTVTVDGIPLTHDPQTLLASDQLKPACLEQVYPQHTVNGDVAPPVRVKLFVGIAERKLHEGGWYIFCNGRLVLRADQSAETVWGPAHDMRQYHPDFAYFRGFAYFDSDNAASLPWTTTKTGVDADSPLYRTVQQVMIEATKPVLAFLTDLAKEKAAVENGEGTETPLQSALQHGQVTRLEFLESSSTFVPPRPPPRPTGPRMQRIQYSKPLSEVEKVKELLGVRSFTAVGEGTFEYYLECEGE